MIRLPSGSGPLRAAAVPAALVTLGLAVYFAPFWLLGMHTVPFHLEPSAVTGIAGAGAAVAGGEGFPGGDNSSLLIHYPNAWLVGEYFRTGRLPTWNPFVACGAPCMGNGQAFPLNPFLWVFYLFPSPWTYTLGLLLGSAFCAAGAYLFLGRFARAPWQRAFGALLWTFNPWTVRLIIYSDVWAAWWFAWVLWAWEGVLERRRSWWLPAPLLALMACSGHVEASFLLASASAAYALVFWTRQEPGARLSPGPLLARALGVAGLAGLLSALQWLPVLARTAESSSYKFDDPWSVTVPFYLWSSLFRPRSEVYLSPLVFAALCAGVPALREKRLLRLPLLFLGASALWAFAAIPLSPLVHALTLGGLLPGVYARCLLWCGAVPLVVAAVGMAAEGDAPRRYRFAAAVAAGFCLMRLAGWLAWRGTGSGAGRDLVLFETGCAALLLIAILSPTARLRSLALALCVVGIFLVPLAARGFRWPYFTRADPLAGGPPAIARLRSTDPSGAGRMAGPWLGPATAALSPNLASVWGVRDARVNDVLNSRRYVRLHKALLPDGETRLGTWLTFPGVAPQTLGLLGVTAYAMPSDLSDASMSWGRVQGLPRAYLVHRVLPAVSEREAAGLFAARCKEPGAGRLRDEAIVEGLGGATTVGAPSDQDTVGFLEDGLDRVVLRATSESSAVLVLLDSYAGGWRAEVDGRPAPIHPANLAFRAVQVPAGGHEVAFTYRPSSVAWGKALAGLGLLLLLAAALRSKGAGRP